jgi:hypothetical protein
MVIALIPTNGKDNAQDIHKQHLKLLKMAEHLELKILVLAVDGADPESVSQQMMDQEASDAPPLIYEYKLYGIHVQAPVFKTGPLILVPDPLHSRKTGQNQPQYGTHTASMGTGFLVNRSLVDVFEIEGSGLQLNHVENVDKQDDGAARHVYHLVALMTTTILENGI